MRKFILAAAILTLAIFPVSAAPTTALKFQTDCHSWLYSGTCNSYLAGFANGLLYGNRICLPSGVTPPQIMRVFNAYADRHPEQIQLPAETLAAKAFEEAFPCYK